MSKFLQLLLLLLLFACNSKTSTPEIIGLWEGVPIDRSMSRKDQNKFKALMRGAFDLQLSENEEAILFMGGRQAKGKYLFEKEEKKLIIIFENEQAVLKVKSNKLELDLDGNIIMFERSLDQNRKIGANTKESLNEHFEKQLKNIFSTWELVHLKGVGDTRLLQQIELGTQISFNEDETFKKSYRGITKTKGTFVKDEEFITITTEHGRVQKLKIEKIELGELTLVEENTGIIRMYDKVYQTEK